MVVQTPTFAIKNNEYIINSQKFRESLHLSTNNSKSTPNENNIMDMLNDINYICFTI